MEEQCLVNAKYFNYPTASAFSVAGGHGGQTLFLLDGTVNMDPMSNVDLPLPFPDALQEFKVETSSLPANYGMAPGGVVNVVTKSGANEFHGGAFEFLRNYAFNARNFFAKERDSLKRSQFGGHPGGPILKNKLFFFGGYQGTYEKVSPAANTNYVATAVVLQGDFTAIASPACNNGKQITLKAPFVGNKVDPSLLAPVSQNLLKLIPTSTDPCGKPSTFSQDNGQIGNERMHIPSLYVHDNFRINSNLTANFGLRWDTFLLPHHAQNKASIFDRAWFDTGIRHAIDPGVAAQLAGIDDLHGDERKLYYGLARCGQLVDGGIRPAQPGQQP